MLGWCYMLRCADGSYYVGSHRGDDVMSRVHGHQQGAIRTAYTYRRRPVELVWCESFELVTDAINCERKLKGWSRAKKEALVRGDYAEIVRLSRGPGYRPSTVFEAKLAQAAREAAEEESPTVGVHPRPSTGSG